ncbi:MAG: hypothetical protein NVS2B17_02770 [Candidatus Velthaea sp.]
MLNEFARWISERTSDRRTANRKKTTFGVGWMRGEDAVPGIGMEISLNGMLFATQRAPDVPSFNVILDLAGRRIKARLAAVRTESIIRAGTAWTMLACTFEGIAADDYDAIVRFIRDLPEPENKAQNEIAAATRSDDAYRLLPMPVQERIVRILTEKRRLAPDSDPRNPLLRMKYLGSKAGAHRFAVHSRIAIGDEIQQYDSAFTVTEDGAVTLDR